MTPNKGDKPKTGNLTEEEIKAEAEFRLSYPDFTLYGPIEKEKVKNKVDDLRDIFTYGVLSATAKKHWEPKWTLVKEKLPADNQNILFALSEKDIRMGLFVAKDQWDRPNIFLDGAFHNSDTVLKWMPRPEFNQ